MTSVGADRVGGDQRAFEHLVRVVAQDRAVLERARLALGAVDHDGRRDFRRRVRAHRPPLRAGREAGAAAAAQAGRLELVDDRLRLDWRGAFAQRRAGAEVLDRVTPTSRQARGCRTRWTSGMVQGLPL